jgi:hypothetical protein
MDDNDDREGSDNCGRKGVAYDWQGLYAATQAADLDGEWARLAATVAESP